jgi:hypothetical protein
VLRSGEKGSKNTVDDLTKEQVKELHDVCSGLREGARVDNDASPLDRLAYFGLVFFEVMLAQELAKYPAETSAPAR